LKDNKPIFERPRDLPNHEHNIVRKQLDEWMEKCIIEPFLFEYAMLVVIIKTYDDLIEFVHE